MEKPTEIYIVKETKDVSDLSLHGDDLSGITPNVILIPR